METIEEEGGVPKSKNSLMPPDAAPIGGLLGNVSLLTTGGSSLQQQMTLTDKGMSASDLRHAVDRMEPNKKFVNTSTPARPFTGETVMYGFDLSPVHSYETKQPGIQLKDTLDGTNVTENIQHSLEQEKLEDEMFVDRKAKSAPNFMQAPLVASPQQSRSGVTPDKIRNNDTETMMRQVYSSDKKQNTYSRSANAGKKKNKSSSVASKSPPYVHNTPRKSSKRYSNIQSSGYGATSPPKSRSKQSKSVSRFGASSTAKESGSFLNPSAAGNQYLNFVHQSKRGEEKKSATLQSSGSVLLKDSLASTTEVGSYHPDTTGNATMTEKQRETFQPNDTEHQVKYEMLEIRYNAIQDECKELQEKNNAVKQENFLLSAKLHRVMERTEKETDDTVTGQDSGKNEVENLKKELAAQENLINGYQQENERVYKELTKAKTSNQENEAAMFNENLRLKGQVAALKEELTTKDDVIKDKNLIIRESNATHVQRVNRSLQTDEDFKSHIKKVNFKCTEHLETIKDLQDKLSYCETAHSTFEKDHERYRKTESDLRLMKSQVARMKKELLLKNGAKKESQLVQDLRRQVRELEAISVKQQTTDHVQSLIHGDSEVVLWKERAEKLEERLKEQDENSSNGIKSLQNMYSKMRLEYEHRVDELAEQLQLLKLHTNNNNMKPDKTSEIRLKQVEHENQELRQKVHALEQNLANDRKVHENKINFYKKKLKATDTKSYHPGYFANIPKSELKEITNSTESLKKTYSLEKKLEHDLSAELQKWQKQYEELKQSNDKLKSDHEKMLTEICKRHNDDAQMMRTEVEKLRERLETKNSLLISTQAEQLSCQSREKALQLQIKNLLDELHETRSGSPNILVRRLADLQTQVRTMDVRQRAREDKLNSAMTKNADSCLREEVQHLQTVIGEKNLLLSKFRCELDSILQVLEGLHNSALPHT
uniref:Centrosomal protein of 162 kDa n=1 Tax=Phallusia mammillata TaxID=59560 RepID=A0A6F9D9L8_9ASCI|nr:centrosomal protein of 162 kDa-like [Phallusia mammillata]